MSEVMHGGRLDEAVAQYGGVRDKWLDLSTGINPHAYALPDIPAESWTSLPDRDAEHSAREAARSCYGAPASTGISLAPGSQMHIQLLPYLYKPQPVAIVGFTYQEHGVCWQRAGHQVYMTDGLSSAESTARIVIVVNPNNPDGRVFEADELVPLARRLAAKGGLLIVDESFADAMPGCSVAGEAGRDGLLVMRSIGKFYGLAGVRFGAALTSPQLQIRLDERLGPWAVSGPALAIAEAVLSDRKWQKRTLKKLETAGENLRAILDANGIERVGHTALFVLVQHERAGDLWENLAEKHILTRSFPGKTDWLRLGLPPGRAGLNKLDKALATFQAE
ncbi:MAG: threonine-phosphate decarboxylase CobD [Rhizobiaceae bacterium]